MKATYRVFIIVNNETHFTKKLSLDDAIKFMQTIQENNWCAGILDGELPLADAKALFANLHEPTCGWEE